MFLYPYLHALFNLLQPDFLSFPLLGLVQGSLNPCINLIFVYHAILFISLSQGFLNLTDYYKHLGEI